MLWKMSHQHHLHHACGMSTEPVPSFPTKLKLSRSQNKLQTSKFCSSKAARDSAATNDIP